MTGPPAAHSGWRGRRRSLRPLRNNIVAAIGPPLVRLWSSTLRVRWLGAIRGDDGFPAGGPSGIYCFWHQSLLAVAGQYRNSGIIVIVSSHGDGEMIARVIVRLGMETVRGSTTRGGTRAIRELLRNGDETTRIAITPDGPRGPRHRFQSGPLYLSSKTGLPVYPVAVVCERGLSLPTWDRFILPCPFSRVLVRLGDAVTLPVDASRERIEDERLRVESHLRQLTEQTQANFRSLYEASLRWGDVPRAPAPEAG